MIQPTKIKGWISLLPNGSPRPRLRPTKRGRLHSGWQRGFSFPETSHRIPDPQQTTNKKQPTNHPRSPPLSYAPYAINKSSTTTTPHSDATILSPTTGYTKIAPTS